MDSGYVSINAFKKLESKVNRILEMHEQDEELTESEAELVREAKEDISNKRMEKFVKIQ